MYYYFKQEISTESVNNLVEKLEQAEGEINLYFSTNGGDSTAMSFLISFFNSVADRLTITLTNDVWSAGTQVLYEYKGKIKLDLDGLDSSKGYYPENCQFITKEENILKTLNLSENDVRFIRSDSFDWDVHRDNYNCSDYTLKNIIEYKTFRGVV